MTSQQAANLTASSAPLRAISQRVAARRLAQEQPARRLGLTRPRLDRLLRGRLDKVSLDARVNIVASAGYVSQIELEHVARPTSTSDEKIISQIDTFPVAAGFMAPRRRLASTIRSTRRTGQGLIGQGQAVFPET